MDYYLCNSLQKFILLDIMKLYIGIRFLLKKDRLKLYHLRFLIKYVMLSHSMIILRKKWCYIEKIMKM